MKIRPPSALLSAAILSAAACRLFAAAPAIDKPRLSSYIRYGEGLTDAVAISVEDPVPSTNPNYFRIVVHLTAGKLNLGDKLYYVSPDGRNFVGGSVWRLDQNPFEDVISLLPASGPAFGATDPKVKILVFSDFECPFCKGLAETLRDKLPAAFGNDVRVQFADYPLESKHPWARAAAEASHCIGDHDVAAFWKFHDWMFAHQSDIAPDGKNLKDKVLEFAQGAGLNSPALAACIDTHATAEEVTASIRTANMVGVQQTPTMFIDGRKVEGALPWPNLEPLLKFELGRPKDIPMPTK